MATNAPLISRQEHNRNWAPPLRDLHNSPTVQSKLEIGKSGDKYEQQADAMADKVMMASYDRTNMVMMAPNPDNPTLRMEPMPKRDRVMMAGNPNNPTLRMKQEADIMGQPVVQMMENEEEEPMVQMMENEEEEPMVQMKCGDCDQEEKLQKKPAIQKSEEGNTHASADLTNKIHGSKGQGQPLTNDMQLEMGSKIGADFSKVNIHTDKEAIQMNKKLGAKAFTHGNDIYFNKGQYNPSNVTGKHLLAHELTHTVQQGEGEKIQRLTVSALPASNVGSAVCGDVVHAYWDFTLDNTYTTTGYIVQAVTRTQNIHTCGLIDNTYPPPQDTIYEAWRVSAGNTIMDHHPTYTDHSSATTFNPSSATKEGTNGMSWYPGTIKYFPISVTGNLGNLGTAGTVTGWSPGNVPGTGDLPSSWTEPTWWTSTPTEGPESRDLNVAWNCCPGYSNYLDATMEP